MFADYLKPLTTWIQTNPDWALLFTFLISFSESLAIVGSIIPGSVTMTAIGILAGSGIMRIDLTFIAAILGAVVGDSASYALGFTFRNRLLLMWPFSRYPNWLQFGKEYFARHGGKSVLLGRFFGPLRSLVPLIAGMMHMNRWHFLLANVISAIGWSALYLLPGILIGAASAELSAESSSRLFVFILLTLLIIWVLGIVLKWLFQHINLALRVNFHRFWLWSKSHPRLAKYLDWLTPLHEDNHYPTVSLLIILALSLFIFCAITLIVVGGAWLQAIDQPIYLLLQSLRTPFFDIFFIIISLFTNPLVLLGFLLIVVGHFLYQRDGRGLRFWLSLVLSCSLSVFILSVLIDVPETADLIRYNIKVFYPSPTTTFATALFGFFIFYMSRCFRSIFTLIIRSLFLAILILSGIASLYLGDNWLTGVISGYALGMVIFLTHWIFFRRNQTAGPSSPLSIVWIVCLYFFVILGMYFYSFKYLEIKHTPYYQLYTINEEAWWGQKQVKLPLYTMNRLGKKTGLYNLQYAGSLTTLEKALVTSGWKKISPSFFYGLLLRAGGEDTLRLPLLNQLYLNQKPFLVMTHKTEQGYYLILRVWRSNYYLNNYSRPIWLGSIHYHFIKNQQNRALSKEEISRYLLKGLQAFQTTHYQLNRLEKIPKYFTPDIFFIKEPGLDSIPGINGSKSN